MSKLLKAIASIAAPFVAILVGMMLQLSLVDQVPPGQPPSVYLMEHYGRRLWLTFIVSSYLTAAGLLLKDTISKSTKGVLIYGPLIAFVVCVFFVSGLPKLSWGGGDLLTVWIPAALSAGSLGFVGYKLGD